jgi:hypothetical protein
MIGEKTDMKIVKWTGDQVPAVSCVVSTVQLKWQVTMVSREETMPVMSRWNGQIVLIASTISNGQSTQIVHRGQIDQRDMTGPDTISSCRKTMLIEEGGQMPRRRASVPNITLSSETSGTGGAKFQTLQPALSDKIGV